MRFPFRGVCISDCDLESSCVTEISAGDLLFFKGLSLFSHFLVIFLAVSSSNFSGLYHVAIDKSVKDSAVDKV